MTHFLIAVTYFPFLCILWSFYQLNYIHLCIHNQHAYIWWGQVHHQAHISRLYNFWHFHKHLSGIFRTRFQLWEAFFWGGRALGSGIMFSHCMKKLSNEISSTILTQGNWGKRKEFKLNKLNFFNTVANALCWTQGTGEHKQWVSSARSDCDVYFWVQVRDLQRFLSSIQVEREFKICYMQESTKDNTLSSQMLSSSKVKSKITNKTTFLFQKEITLLNSKCKKKKKKRMKGTENYPIGCRSKLCMFNFFFSFFFSFWREELSDLKLVIFLSWLGRDHSCGPP